MSKAPGRRWRLPSALAHRDFRLYLAGQTLSQLGTKMQNAALLWHLYTLTHSPYALGAFGIARLLPLLLLGLVGGVFADRIERRKLLVVTQLTMAALAIVLGVWSYEGMSSPWPIYLISSLTAVVGAFDTPARQSLLPTVVPDADLTSAIGLDALTQKITKVAGPLIMAPMIIFAGPGLVYVVNAVSYVAVIGALLLMKPPVHTPGTLKLRGTLVEAFEGVRHVASSGILGPLLALDFAATFFGAADTVLPLFATEVLHLGAEGYGILAAAAPVGAVLGALGMGLVGKIADPRKRTIQATAVYGLAIIAVGLSRNIGFAIAALAVASAADTISTVLRNTLRQATTPDHLRGRVAALSTLLTKSGPWLGEMEAGIAAGVLGIGASIVLGGAACLVSVIVFSPVLRSRQLRAQLETAAAAPPIEARAPAEMRAG